MRVYTVYMVPYSTKLFTYVTDNTERKITLEDVTELSPAEFDYQSDGGSLNLYVFEWDGFRFLGTRFGQSATQAIRSLCGKQYIDILIPLANHKVQYKLNQHISRKLFT